MPKASKPKKTCTRCGGLTWICGECLQADADCRCAYGLREGGKKPGVVKCPECQKPAAPPSLSKVTKVKFQYIGNTADDLGDKTLMRALGRLAVPKGWVPPPDEERKAKKEPKKIRVVLDLEILKGLQHLDNNAHDQSDEDWSCSRPGEPPDQRGLQMLKEVRAAQEWVRTLARKVKAT